METQITLSETTTCDNINVIAEGSPVISVNRRIGAVTLSATDVGLGNADNTSDLNKPISNDTLSALNVLQNEIDDINNNSFSITTTVESNSANWDTAYSYVISNSGIEENQEQVSTFVNTNSANILEVNTVVNTTSANWDNVYTNVVLNSALYVYENIYANAGYVTIEQFAASNPQNIYKGYNITLINNRVYTFAGSDTTNPNHYLEINANPITAIYQEIELTQNQTLIDSFPLSDFKTAKYTLQIETTFNNDIYYSELNVVASINPRTAVVSEYGQISTSDLILGYTATVDVNNVNLFLIHNIDNDNTHQLIVKGARTNHYKI